MAAFMKGETLTYHSTKQTATIEWKQGSFLGIGGDKSENYYECSYKMGDHEIPVYIQTSYDRPDRLRVDSKLQYGMNNGVMFLVLHSKSNTPYQHRFVRNPKQEWLRWANELQKTRTGYDPSWIAGDYLRDF